MPGFEDILIRDGVLSVQDLASARRAAGDAGTPLSEVLLSNGAVSEPRLLQALADYHGLRFVDLRETVIDPAAVRVVSPKLASHYGVLPVAVEGRTLTIAVSDVMDVVAAEDIETNLGYRVERVLARGDDIKEALRRHYGTGAETVERILAEAPGDQTAIALDATEDLEKMAEDASVVRLVNQLLQEAIAARATDLHLEIERDSVHVRRRVDGILYDTQLPKNIRVLYPAIVSRIKLMSGLNIVERRLPQDGRARVRVGSTNYDLRISVVPAVHGEDIVARILPASMLFDLPQLGFSGAHLDRLEGLIRNPHGIIFVTGPTGSGKSTTLYACLNRLNSRDRKIITIEDPVEYELAGLTQTQINPAIGLTFSRALRSMLRHDPDVMMVGEVRDRETAEIAVQTAMTGHLVLSTLHTNDSASAAVRLVDMGVDAYLITATTLSFIAQRLVRLICPDCREPYEHDGRTLHRGRGCRACNGCGYRGRLAISEFLMMEPQIQRMILAKAPAADIRSEADRLGMETLAQDGWHKVEAGLTTADEVLRVTRL